MMRDGQENRWGIKKKFLLLCSLLMFLSMAGITQELLTDDAGGASDLDPQYRLATFAGGCFWCMEPPFDARDGVLSTISGYTGGHQQDPNYQTVSSGESGHVEAVQIIFDPQKISYQELLEIFWKNIDPTDPNGQFCDKGRQYRSVIYYHDPEQQKLAEESKLHLGRVKSFQQDIITEITQASIFYPAESYHQDYYQKNPIRYKFYRYSCGRDKRLKALWETPATS